ncbi:MAG: class I SAM-dependent methyltransferase [Pseudanabaenaceae cyanobacterium SKYGB_i_bin29]|nr:class I SAM-dependent methyltransferase [Pseudanabaenaceae cyanobacterium SKYG29]MDW8422419.1 class I SAM-dependent methyltransferase [Pseudanabaenaceae cyanobacterium SKYGB_i_bin29]
MEDLISQAEKGQAYCHQMTTPVPTYRQEIEAQTAPRNMVSGQLITQLLQILIRTMGARRVLELGTLTGYSALAMAEVLPPDGLVITCDRDGQAQANFDRVPWGQKIQLRVGLIADTLQVLIQENQQFDLVFLDADKRNYCNYYQTILDHNLLRPGGILCADNTLFHGEVWQPEPNPTALAVHQFNQLVAQDRRVCQVLLPVRDGITIVYLAAE